MRSLLPIALLLAAACGDDDCAECADTGTDVQQPDAGSPDAGEDAAPPDAGAPDSSVDAPVDAATDSAADAMPPGSYTIATWNIENFPKATATPRYVRETLERHRWDLIAVQEVDRDSIFLSMAEGMEDYSSFVSFDGRAFTRAGILYRQDRVRIVDVERIFRVDQDSFPRDPLVATFEFLDETGAVVFDGRLVVLHLKATMEQDSQRRRREAIVKLDQWVRDTIAAGADPDVILAGDYNDDIADPAGDNVFAPFIDGPYAILTEEVPEGDYSFIPFRGLIDHIIITDDAVEEYGTGTTFIVDLRPEILNYVSNVSDHLPVVSRFVP